MGSPRTLTLRPGESCQQLPPEPPVTTGGKHRAQHHTRLTGEQVETLVSYGTGQEESLSLTA